MSFRILRTTYPHVIRVGGEEKLANQRVTHPLSSCSRLRRVWVAIWCALCWDRRSSALRLSPSRHPPSPSDRPAYRAISRFRSRMCCREEKVVREYIGQNSKVNIDFNCSSIRYNERISFVSAITVPGMNCLLTCALREDLDTNNVKWNQLKAM